MKPARTPSEAGALILGVLRSLCHRRYNLLVCYVARLVQILLRVVKWRHTKYYLELVITNSQNNITKRLDYLLLLSADMIRHTPIIHLLLITDYISVT